jgi:TolB protein
MRVPLLAANLNRILAVTIMSLFLVAGCGPLVSVANRAAPQSPLVVPRLDGPIAGNIQPAVQPALTAQQSTDGLPGRILFVRDGNIWMWQGGNSRQFSQGGTWSQPQFSPDGKEVAYVYWDSNFSDLFVMAADGSDSRRLTRGQSPRLPDNSWAMRPTWSPDGNQLAFVTDANSNHNQVWVMAKDGSARKQLTSEALGILWADALSWEPDGTRLAVTAAPDMAAPSHIYMVDVARGTFEKFSNQLNGAFDPAFSPDGSALAYIGRPSSQTTLTIQTIDGAMQATFDKLPFLRSPVWSPDGKSVAVLSAQGGVFEIWILSITATDSGIVLGEPRQLTRDAAIDPMSGLSWTR